VLTRSRFTARFAVLIVAASALAACGSSSSSGSSTKCPNAPSGTVPKITPVTAGTLTVVTSLPGPGFMEGSDTNPTKITHGYEYCVAKIMQEKFGLSKLVIRNANFDAIVAGQVKDYDLALSQISITAERAKVVDFSTSYFQSNQGILVRKGTTVKTLADAKKLKWGVQTSTTAIDLLTKLKPDTAPKVYKNLPDAYTALQAKQVDAVLIDTAINLGEAARSNGKFVVAAQFNQPGGPDQYGAILPKGSVNKAAVDAVFNLLKSSGVDKTLKTEQLTADPGNIPVIQLP
jgi:polar amino acid transport system substrate-binding protein